MAESVVINGHIFWDHKVTFLKEIPNTWGICTSGPQLDRLALRETPRYGVWRGITAFFPNAYLSLIIFLWDQRAPEEECLSHAHARGSGTGTVALYGQFDWIYYHVGDTPLGMSVRVFPERISSGGKMHPDGNPIPLAEGPLLDYCWENQRSSHICLPSAFSPQGSCLEGVKWMTFFFFFFEKKKIFCSLNKTPTPRHPG